MAPLHPSAFAIPRAFLYYFIPPGTKKKTLTRLLHDHNCSQSNAPFSSYLVRAPRDLHGKKKEKVVGIGGLRSVKG